MFDEFRQLRSFRGGEGITESSLDSWMKARKSSKAFYAEMFRSDNLKRLSVCDFTTFLYYRNNRSWTQLYRQGLQLTQHMGKLKRAIKHLQDGSFEVGGRIRNVMIGGRYHVNGLGKNLVTGILHTCDREDKYGVWNNRVIDGLKKLGINSKISQDNGLTYKRINEKLLLLKERLSTDLVYIDGFMWFLSTHK